MLYLSQGGVKLRFQELSGGHKNQGGGHYVDIWLAKFSRGGGGARLGQGGHSPMPSPPPPKCTPVREYLPNCTASTCLCTLLYFVLVL